MKIIALWHILLSYVSFLFNTATTMLIKSYGGLTKCTPRTPCKHEDRARDIRHHHLLLLLFVVNVVRWFGE